MMYPQGATGSRPPLRRVHVSKATKYIVSPSETTSTWEKRCPTQSRTSFGQAEDSCKFRFPRPFETTCWTIASAVADNCMEQFACAAHRLEHDLRVLLAHCRGVLELHAALPHRGEHCGLAWIHGMQSVSRLDRIPSVFPRTQCT